MAKFSLKSTLNSFLCLLPSGAKGSSFPGAAAVGVWALSPARSQPPALGSWTGTVGAKTVHGQGAQLQAQLALRSFPDWLSCSAGLALPTCTSHSLTVQLRVSAWSWKHLVNGTCTKLCGFLRLQLCFVCLGPTSTKWATFPLTLSFQKQQNCWSYFFFSILVAWLHLWDFGHPLNQSILIDQWWQHHSDSKSQSVPGGHACSTPEKCIPARGMLWSCEWKHSCITLLSTELVGKAA